MIESEYVQQYHCPRWDELPGIPLYMDQVIMVINEALSVFSDHGEPILTRAMINNYVKHKIITPPEKKKYQRKHIAQLIVLSLCKKVFSMSEIRTITKIVADHFGMEAAYDLFCHKLEAMLRIGFSPERATLTMTQSESPAEQLLEQVLVSLICRLMVQYDLAAREAGE